MKLKVVFHRVNPSQALKKFIKDQSRKLEKFFREKNVELRWFVEKENRVFVPAVNFHYQGRDYHFESSNDNPYIGVHDVIRKAKRSFNR